MKIVIAGTGSIGKRHIQNLHQLKPDCEIILLRSDGRVDSFSESLSAPVVRNLDEAMEHAPSGLVIATPSSFHAQLLMPAIELDLPVYVEKPMVTSSSDLEKLNALVKRQKYTAPSLVGCNLRYLPSLQQLRKLVHDGAIGHIVRANFEAGQWLPDWRPFQDYKTSYSADSERGGGVILDLIHEIDAARWILGDIQPVATLTGQAPSLEINSEAVVGALLRGSNNEVITISLDYVARKPIRRYQLVGEKATIVWELSEKNLYLDKPEGREHIDCGEDGFDVAETYLSAMAEFLSVLSRSQATTQPLKDGMKSNDLALRIKELAC